MAVLQYEKHPGKYQGISFYARVHDHFLAMDGIWRDYNDEVLSLLSSHDGMDQAVFEESRIGSLRRGVGKDLEWSLNRLKWASEDGQLSDSISLSQLTDPWFKYRIQAIERARFCHPRTAGPIKRHARLASSSAFSAMHVALCALEAHTDQAKLAALSKTALALPQATYFD